MEYLNQFHKESVERKMKVLEKQKHLILNAEEEAKKHFEMHKRIAKNYPEKSQESEINDQKNAP